jgi:hypothetical protein
MTRRAAGQLGRGPNLVLFPQLGADFRLIVGSLPVHIENLILSAKNWLGIAVAFHAPLHKQGVGLEDQRHLIDLPVASRAAHALIDMNAVIEISKIGQAVNFDPLDRFIAPVALANRFEVGGSVVEHGMAVHAGLGWRNAGHGGSLHAGMTVAAVDAVIANVMLVAELHRLLTRNVLPRQIRRARHRKYSYERQSDQKEGRKDTEARDKIRTSMKNLGHVCSALCRGALR